jgi:hypothetical protein
MDILEPFTLLHIENHLMDGCSISVVRRMGPAAVGAVISTQTA